MRTTTHRATFGLVASIWSGAALSLSACDEARYSRAVIEGSDDVDIDAPEPEPSPEPDPIPDPDPSEVGCPDPHCSDEGCVQQGGWRFTATTTGIPPEGGLMPTALKAFPAPPRSPFAGIIASHATGAQGSPEQVRFWYVDKATESIEEGSGHTEPAGFPVNIAPDGDLDLLVDVTPADGDSEYGTHYFVVADNRDVVCDLQAVHMGVVESQPSTWPALSARLPELLSGLPPDLYQPGLGIVCQIQSVALLALENNMMRVALGIVFPDANTAAMVAFNTTTSLVLGQSEVLGLLVGEEGAEVSLVDLRWGEHPLNLSGLWQAGSTLSLVAYHDAGGNRAPDLLVVPIGVGPSARAAQDPTLFDSAMGSGRSRFFVLEPQGVLGVHEIQGMATSRIAALPSAGNRLWIHRAPPERFDILWGELIWAPGSGRYSIDLARQAIDGATWQPEGAPRPLLRVDSGGAQDQALGDVQVVIDDSGTASLFYRRLQFSERTSAQSIFVYDLSPGCLDP